MSERKKMIRLLHEKAAQFRGVAGERETAFSPRLREIAGDLEAQAEELETLDDADEEPRHRRSV